MKPGWRGSILWAGVFWLLVAIPACRAGWDFTAPGDPNRNWNAELSSGVAYDDNFNSSEFNRESGIRYDSDLTLRAKETGERTVMNGQYDYSVLYPNYLHEGGVAQTHTLNLAANYSVDPRLLLSINENFVDSFQPQLVQTIDKVPVTVQQAGTYIYDTVGAGATYSLTRRWAVSASGSWDIWRYQEAAFATNNDHQDYSVTLSALYTLNPRTVVGVNYQYAAGIYSNPGFRDGLNAESDTGYLSVSHQFNPKLSLVLNGGYTVRNSQDGTTSTAPSAYGSIVYNYGPMDSVVVSGAESLSSASVSLTRQYSAQETMSFSLQLNHRFTARLHTIVEGTYANSQFTAQLLNQNLQVENAKPTYESITAHCGIGYDFRVWLSANLDYYYTLQMSSSPGLVTPYSRDQVGLRLTLTY